MIFVTVGTQLAFPRLLDCVNELAPSMNEEFVVQGNTELDRWPNLTVHSNVEPIEYEQFFKGARLVVGHAGIGTYLSARLYGKPLVVLPRRCALGEHRNDHQLATAAQLDGVEGVTVAWDNADLPGAIETARVPVPANATSPQSAQLIERLASFIRA